MILRALYDSIGRGYRGQRQADPRIAARLTAALGEARSVLNVGAGAGSYEPVDRRVVAVEPSAVMLTQRPLRSAAAVQAPAEALPFADRSFDAVLAVLTVHHWLDLGAGLSECARVARDRVVLLTWDPVAGGFWLVREYLCDLFDLERRGFPTMAAIETAFGAAVRLETTPVPIPADCADGFLGAFWARPEAYLDPAVRAGISWFAREGADRGLERLREDLASGAWHARHGDLLRADAVDIGYRLVVAHLPHGCGPIELTGDGSDLERGGCDE